MGGVTAMSYDAQAAAVAHQVSIQKFRQLLLAQRDVGHPRLVRLCPPAPRPPAPGIDGLVHGDTRSRQL